MAEYTVLFQGDSITDCGRGACGNCGYQANGMGPGYPGLVSCRLLLDRPDIKWNFFNRGISGNRVVDLYARWKVDCLNLKPDVVSILIGVNDTWHEFGNQNGVEVPRYERFYREILQWTKDVLPDVKFILMDPFVAPAVPGMEKPEFVPEVTERIAVVEKLAEEFNAIHIPLQDIFNDAFKLAPQEYWTADGVHPSPAGHQLIADNWLKAAKDLFR